MRFTNSELEMIYQYAAPTKAETIGGMKETVPVIKDLLTRVIMENAITATVSCWITASLAYVYRVSAIPSYAAGFGLPCCRWTGNWNPPCSTGQTGNAVPSAAGIFSPNPTGGNTARIAPQECAAGKKPSDSGKDTTFLRI